MAEKFQRKFRKLNLQYLIGRSYNNGISQSCIIHVLILLMLSCVISADEKPRKSICITLSESEPIKHVNMEQTTIEISDPEPLSHNADEQVAEVISETLKEDNVPLVIDINDMVLKSEPRKIDNLLFMLSDKELTREIIVEKKETKLVKKQSSNKDIKRKYTNNTQGINVGASQLSDGNGTGVGIGGGDMAELDRRLQQFGARTGDVQISLSWNTIDDIDLHVIVLPIRSQINWTNKRGPCGGMLDIDMNAHPQMVLNRPIENVFWPNHQAPQGIYVVGIQNYMPWSRNIQTNVLVVVKIKGKVVQSKNVIVGYGEGVKEVLRFNF